MSSSWRRSNERPMRAATRCSSAIGREVAIERAYLDVLRKYRLTGDIWSVAGRPEHYREQIVGALPGPLVFVDRVCSTFEQFDSVVLDNVAAGRQATEYLLDMGIATSSSQRPRVPGGGRDAKRAFCGRSKPVMSRWTGGSYQSDVSRRGGFPSLSCRSCRADQSHCYSCDERRAVRRSHARDKSAEPFLPGHIHCRYR